MEKFILALDQGTTSLRAIIFDRRGKIKSMAQKEFKQFYPQANREHNSHSIDNWNSAVDRSKNWLKDETALKEFSL